MAAPTIHALVDIGDGRELKLVCRGTGSPTVLFISGTRGAADEWDNLAAGRRRWHGVDLRRRFADHTSMRIRPAGYHPRLGRADDLDHGASADHGGPERRRPARTDGGHRPRRAVRRRRAVMGRPDRPAVRAKILRRGRRSRAAGLGQRVPADDVLGPAVVDVDGSRREQSGLGKFRGAFVRAGASIVELRATPTLPAMPTVVVSSDQPWDLQVTPGESTWPGWVAAQAELARALDAKHITDPDSGHGIPVEQPALVTEAVLDVVSAER